MLSNPASRRVCTARRTSSGEASRSSTSSSAGWKLCAPSETRVTPCARRSAASSAVTVSGLASTVTSSASRQRAQQPLEPGDLGERGRSPAQEHGVETIGEHVALQLELGEERIDVAAVLRRRARRP